MENTLYDLERRHQVRSLNQILEDKEHLFTLTFNQSSVGMALSSLEGLWLRANPGLEQQVRERTHELSETVVQLHRADAAMYRAKQAGKGRFVLDL